MFKTVFARDRDTLPTLAPSSNGSSDMQGLITAMNRSLATIQFDPHGIILDANENFLRAMGYSLDEVKGKHHMIFVEPEYARSREYEEFWAKLRSGEFDAAAYKRIGKGGKEVWIQASYNPIFDDSGKVVRVVKFATDVTRETMRNADFEGQLKALHRVLGVIEFDLDGTIRKANDLFLNLVGYTLDEVAGRHHSLFVDPAEAQSDAYREFWNNLRLGRPDKRVFRRFGKHGKPVWLEASYIPVLDPDGRPRKVVKFATDLSTVMVQTEATQRMAVGVAAATEEMSSSIAEIGRSVALSQEITASISKTADASGGEAASLVASMRAMEGIVGLIRDIAQRVSILALNAAIEAARAGEAGKGFAVVASEVKNLSSQTAKATDEIAKEIGTVQAISGKVATGIHETAEGVGKVAQYVVSVATAIEQQRSATQEIAEHSSRMVTSVEEMVDRMLRKR
jgi:methyl-accepting chemotaxis protein